MQPVPRLVSWTHAVFNVSVLAAAAFGLVSIWHPLESETLQKSFWSVLVLLAASTLLLAGYRTVRVLRSDS